MVKFFLRLSLVCTILAATSTGTEERGLRLPDFEQGNSRAGFCFDLKLLIGFAGDLFFVFVVLAGSSARADGKGLVSRLRAVRISALRVF